MTEKIYNLPVDKIPLSSEEKDVFQWLYPLEKKEKKDVEIETTVKENQSTKDKNKTRQIQYYINFITSFILIFCAVYPKWNFFWKKLIPTDENNIVFSFVKVFTVFFIMYFINFMFHKYN